MTEEDSQYGPLTSAHMGAYVYKHPHAHMHTHKHGHTHTPIIHVSNNSGVLRVDSSLPLSYLTLKTPDQGIRLVSQLYTGRS